MSRVDPICGMTGVIERHEQWFCSERCAAQYVAKRSTGDACHVPTRGAWWRDPWVWVPVSGVVIAVLGWCWPRAAGVSEI